MSNRDYLTPQEERVYRVLRERRGDVSIFLLYEHARNVIAPSDPRVAQQFIGAVISRINRKLDGDGKIVPGRKRQTYRFTR